MGKEAHHTDTGSATRMASQPAREPSSAGGPVAIAGMHRAGTSMIAKALRLAGLHLGLDGDLVDPAPDNPGGFFEHAGFVRLGDLLLEATGGAWDHPPACPPMAADDDRVAHLRDQALALIEEVGVAPVWGWKDPRTSLTARFWLDLLPDLRVVVCVRHPLEVALSLKQRNNTSYAHSLSLWHGYYEALLDAVAAERRVVTHIDAHARDAEGEIARLLSFVGLPLSGAAEAASAREPELRHHRVETPLSDAGVDPRTVELYRRLCEEAGEPAGDAGVESGPSARVEGEVLDLHLAAQRLEGRARQVASLESKRDALAERVEELEAAGRDETIARIDARLDRIEGATHELRYSLEDLTGRTDAEALQRCRTLVRSEVPRTAEVMVVAKDDAPWLDLYGRPTANFPRDATGRYPGFTFDDGVAALAHLEARRAHGGDFLLIPENARWWSDRFPALFAHLRTAYRVAADEREAGILVDVRSRVRRNDVPAASVHELLDRVSARNGGDLAVLDLTGNGLANELPRHRVFTPPTAGELPYLDDTVDLVLLAHPSDPPGVAQGVGPPLLEEAKRVATTAVVLLDPEDETKVERVDWLSPAHEAAEPPIRFAPLHPDSDPGSLARVGEALAEDAGAELVAVPARWQDLAEDGALVAILEEGVLPLPGCCAAARATFRDGDGIGGVAVKLLAADGAIESAGSAVFADGSWAPVAAGTHQVVAPWHEYVRGTCGGTGMLFLGPQGLEQLAHGGSAPSAGGITSWAASLWGAGLRVVYQPDAAAVRISGGPDESAAMAARVAEAWRPAARSLPARPEVLDAATWQRLLPSWDVEAGSR